MKAYLSNAMAKYVMAFFVVLLASCSSSSSHSDSEAIDGVSVQIVVAKSAAMAIDSLKVTVQGPGMTLIQKKAQSSQSQIELGAIPPGLSRRILVQAYSGSLVIQEGESVVDLKAGESRSIQITLNALYGQLEMTVPLGLTNPLGVTQGRLILTSTGYADTLVLIGALPNRRFISEPLALNQSYLIVVELKDANGAVLFRGQDSVYIEADAPMIGIELGSLFSEISLVLTVKANPSLQGFVALPTAKRRAPQALHELLVLELLPNPKTSGTEWEFTELLNATTDTLVLDSCRLAKDGSTTASTTAVKLTGCFVAPGAYLVIGRDSVAMRGCSAGAFSLSNTGQSVVVQCGSVLVDSIAYNSPTDSLNPFPFDAGISVQIPVDRYRDRSSGAQWCQGRDSIALSPSTKVLGTPGREAVCP